MDDASSCSNFVRAKTPDVLPITKPQAARKTPLRPRLVKQGHTPADETSPSSLRLTNVGDYAGANLLHPFDAVKQGEDGLYHFANEDVERIARAAVLAAHSPPSAFSSAAAGDPSLADKPSSPLLQSTPSTVTQPTATAQYLYNLLAENQHVQSGPIPSRSLAGSGTNALS